MGGHSYASRSKRLALLPKWDSVPMNWLSCPESGNLIPCPNHPKLNFLPIKTPLPVKFFENLPETVRWTVNDAVELARSKCPMSTILTINVSASNEAVSREEWVSAGVEYFWVPITKDFDVESVDMFCDVVNKEIEKNENIICLLFSGRGQNRVRFSIYSYFLKCCQQKFEDIVKREDFYNQKALDALSKLFEKERIEAVEKPAWLANLQDERSISIGEVPLPLEKYKGIKKISRKEIVNNDADMVKALLPPKKPLYQWDNSSLEEVLNAPFQCTFDARGLQTYIVATKESSVYLVDSRNRVWLLRARIHHGHLPLVASCIIVEEQRRCVILLTDLHKYGDLINENSSMEDRLATLAHKVIKKLRTENNSTYLLQFVYRPMAHVSDASKLKKDLPILFAKSDGLLFYGNDKVIRLPLTPSVILQFDYNGNDKAFLLARDPNGELVPVGIYIVTNKKLLGMDRRTSRFEFDIKNQVWTAIALGQDDVPSTVEEVNNMIRFKRLNVSVDDILKKLENVDD